MNVLEKLKARLTDGRVAELQSRIKQMEEEHKQELVYIGQRHETTIEKHQKREQLLVCDNERLRNELAGVAVELGRVHETMGRLVSK